MKKVRFVSPVKCFGLSQMDSSELHSPRPFMEMRINAVTPVFEDFDSPSYQEANEHMTEHHHCDNKTSNILAKKTEISPPIEHSNFMKCNDLDLSIIDTMSQKPNQTLKKIDVINVPILSDITNQSQSITKDLPPNILRKDDGFFIRHNQIQTDKENSSNKMTKQLPHLTINNDTPLLRKAEIISQHPNNAHMPNLIIPCQDIASYKVFNSNNCTLKTRDRAVEQFHENHNRLQQVTNASSPTPNQCPCNINYCVNCEVQLQKYVCTNHKTAACLNRPNLNDYHSNSNNYPSYSVNTSPMTVHKKRLVIEKYEKSKNEQCTDIDKSSSVVQDKHEPTVGDLLKIIKLQNEQLQLLQDKFDKFLNVNNYQQPAILPTTSTNHANHDQDKVSIGVMTSFEVVRTSTIINKDLTKPHNNISTQIQCNRSQISIKEIRQPITGNFLEGLNPSLGRNVPHCSKDSKACQSLNAQHNKETSVDDRIMNDLSLCNVEVDNATTPLLSPDQTMYLDVRDYSDSDSPSEDQSVGWTYYNKVMTHVNGMLHDSDMPSSASALYRNTRPQCVQMQIDKTNISVRKRVQFGDQILPTNIMHQGTAPSSDTSMKMNQLAAKYLNSQQPQYKPTTMRQNPVNEMSFATRNYMERHQILQGIPKSPAHVQYELPKTATSPYDIPKFLDITALKQQPKLL